jgi:hydroxymethylglutaryl-CoA reductase
MDRNNIVTGFSKLDRSEKLSLLFAGHIEKEKAIAEMESYRHHDKKVQKLHDEISENTITNYYLPYSVAPNFLINGKNYILPLVTEESSVVAAMAKSAKFWSTRGGFRTEISEMIKNGQVHFIWNGSHDEIIDAFPDLKERLVQDTSEITASMVNRGGGIVNIDLVDKREHIEGYYQLSADFDTRDSMGANFINSCLEQFAVTLEDFLRHDDRFGSDEKNVEIIMSILSNYTDRCLVTASVSCSPEELGDFVDGLPSEEFISKFNRAVKIAQVDKYRAATHNKGIFNGIDAVMIATGNDFRAVEAAGHAWAARDGVYRGLSVAGGENGRLSLSLTLPLPVGTVGGLTGLHPMAKRSLEILGNPDASELMGIIAAGGLAANFAAIRSLIAGGIQAGHMRMHLSNILNRLGADEDEQVSAAEYFKDRKVGYASVKAFLAELRKKKVR